jgi:hypothetical protein
MPEQAQIRPGQAQIRPRSGPIGAAAALLQPGCHAAVDLRPKPPLPPSPPRRPCCHARRRTTSAAPPLHHLPEPGAGRGLRATVGRDPTAAMPGDRAHHAPPPAEICRGRHEPPRPEPQQPRAPPPTAASTCARPPLAQLADRRHARPSRPPLKHTVAKGAAAPHKAPRAGEWKARRHQHRVGFARRCTPAAAGEKREGEEVWVGKLGFAPGRAGRRRSNEGRSQTWRVKFIFV